MKLNRIAIAALVGVMLTAAAAAAWAARPGGGTVEPRFGERLTVSEQLQRLEAAKERVAQQLQAGRIDKAAAEARTAKIDARIAELKAFDALTLPQKRAKLINDGKARLEAAVKNGRLTQAQADALLAALTQRVNAWDGTGYPEFGPGPFGGKAMRGPGRRLGQRFNAALRQAVADNVITQEQAEKIRAYLKR